MRPNGVSYFFYRNILCSISFQLQQRNVVFTIWCVVVFEGTEITGAFILNFLRYLQTYRHLWADCLRQCGIFNISQLCRPSRPLTGIALLYFNLLYFTLLYERPSLILVSALNCHCALLFFIKTTHSHSAVSWDRPRVNGNSMSATLGNRPALPGASRDTSDSEQLGTIIWLAPLVGYCCLRCSAVTQQLHSQGSGHSFRYSKIKERDIENKVLTKFIIII
jgi:hypothetical protein